MIRAELVSQNDLDAVTARIDRQKLFVLFADLSTEASKEWLVGKLLGHGEASVMFGKPGDGKSVLAQDLGLHIAAGWPWHGRPVRRGAVLYVAMERKQLVKRRAIAFRRKHPDVGDLPFAIAGDVLDLRENATVELIVRTANELEAATGERVVLIILDTLSRGLCGGDENSPKDMGAIVSSTGKLQQRTGAHVMWIHHMPQDAERMRGHGALLGAVDTTILVSKGAASRSATVIKANDSEEGEEISFALESVVIGGEGEDKTSAPIVIPSEARPDTGEGKIKLTKNQQTMFALLHDAGANGLTLDQWNEKAKDAGIGEKRRADLTDNRMALRSKGLVKEYGGRWSVRH